MMKSKNRDAQSKSSFSGLLVASILSAFFFVLMEWLFLVTKPSFMEALHFFRKVEILLFTGSLLGGVILVGLTPGLFLVTWLKRTWPALASWLIGLLNLVPGGVFAALLLLWLDNFTYTVFQYGIVSSRGIVRAGYTLMFLVFIWLGHRISLAIACAYERIASKWKLKLVLPYVLAVMVVLFGFAPFIEGINTPVLANPSMPGNQWPNIFIITSDGVNANNMSVYGYNRDTTPNMRELVTSSLVAENAFPNSGNTAGSVISMYTGKYPSTTRVLYPPNILRGADSYQHLPGILRSIGYRTVQITYPHHVDAYTLNMLHGFDEANGRATESTLIAQLNKHLSYDYAFFSYEISNRLVDRLRHIFFLKQMVNPNDLVTEPATMYADEERLNWLFAEIEQAEKPLFIHLHIMGTHGARFYPSEQVFSLGKSVSEQENWDIDFYDDSIRDFDRYVKLVVDKLNELEILNNSILVIGSDHGQRYTTAERIPMIIRFPNGQHAGRIQTNLQNIDLAPTILDFLGIEQPLWMEGQSFIEDDPGQRPIFAFNVHKAKDGNIMMDKIVPPFYQFGATSVTYCQYSFRLNLESYQLTQQKVSGYVGHCDEVELISEQQILSLILDHFEQRNFDITDMKNSLQSQGLLN